MIQWSLSRHAFLSPHYRIFFILPVHVAILKLSQSLALSQIAVPDTKIGISFEEFTRK